MTQQVDEALRFKISDLMKSEKVTQLDLAKKLNIDNSAVSRILNGTRKVSTEELYVLADVFDVTADYLLGKDATPKWANNQDTKDLEEFLTANEGSMTYDGENLTEDEQEQLRVAMATIFWKRHKHD